MLWTNSCSEKTMNFYHKISTSISQHVALRYLCTVPSSKLNPRKGFHLLPTPPTVFQPGCCSCRDRALILIVQILVLILVLNAMIYYTNFTVKLSLITFSVWFNISWFSVPQVKLMFSRRAHSLYTVQYPDLWDS